MMTTVTSNSANRGIICQRELQQVGKCTIYNSCFDVDKDDCATKLLCTCMQVICYLYQAMFCCKSFVINTKPEFHRTHTCTRCVLSTAVLCRDQHHRTAVNDFTYICDCPSGGRDNTPTNQLTIIITRGHWRPCCDNSKVHIQCSHHHSLGTTSIFGDT